LQGRWRYDYRRLSQTNLEQHFLFNPVAVLSIFFSKQWQHRLVMVQTFSSDKTDGSMGKGNASKI